MPPDVTSQPPLDPPVVTLTEAVNTSCEVEANPPARLLWSVDGVTRAMGTPLRPGASVRCLAENTLGVASAENTEMRLQGLEQRMGQLEERTRTGGRLLGDIARGHEQIRDMEQATDQLEKRINVLENVPVRDKEEWLLKDRTELIEMLESRIEVIDEFQRRHIGGQKGQCDSSLARMAEFVKKDIHKINAKISELDVQMGKLDDKVAAMRKEADSPIIEITKCLDNSKVTSVTSVKASSSASSGSQEDHHGLFFSILMFVFKVALI